jgi:hypothetical protein
MVRKFALAFTVALAAVPTTAYPASVGYDLRLQVPVQCSVRHQPIGYGAASAGGAISLGQFREYCNAPGGYQIVVSYTPGTMRGATISAEDEQVVLNGSGQAILSRASGPRILERTIFATPGENGFDTDRLELQILPLT